ncbi:MAG: PspC domain-containing protein [Chloroflexaceae bacterium]|nr:PspC domain-containing protein [Chloroflexaceae bacterium]
MLSEREECRQSSIVNCQSLIQNPSLFPLQQFSAASNIDPLLVRIGFVALTALNGFGAMLYIVLWLLLPNEDSLSTDSRSQVQENISEMQTAAEQLLERVRGAFQR